ncbi:Alpha/Beta hydrolase protein [Russula earlei]|uniref:Alpha/Beta hydrolase protein n=1 Tax=Russula earlei TaxID=71964 RepID=A0ACC0UH22_9AGAM|nr:Alpha/Beta hydrolase protein [Russula earlei]
MDVDDFLDIPYASAAPVGDRDGPHDPLRSFDLFVPRPTTTTTENRPERSGGSVSGVAAQALQVARPPPLVCFVHGGAWRSEDKTDHGALARGLAAYTSFPVAVPNYRLTGPDNEVRHPAHARDVLQLLAFLLAWPGPLEGSRSPPYDPTRMFLIGHSCSAHMLACILLDSSEPALVPSAPLLRAVRGVVFAEGIYDIDALLRSFPAYRDWFIRDTFGDLSAYDRYSTTKMTLREGASHICWVILHSKGDTLVDTAQSHAMYGHLQSLCDGRPGNVGSVVKSFDDLKGEHNAILQSVKYTEIVGDFILNVTNI